jgi:hypothetical protein
MLAEFLLLALSLVRLANTSAIYTGPESWVLCYNIKFCK